MQQPNEPQVEGSLHDWSMLRSHLLFGYDRPLGKEFVDGTYERRGEYSAWLVRRGWIQVETDRGPVIVRPGQWFFYFGPKIVQVGSPDLHMLSLRFSLSWPNETQVFQNSAISCLLESADYPDLEPTAKRLLGVVGQVEWRREHPAYTFQWRTRVDFSTYLKYRRYLLDWVELVAGVLVRLGWQFCIPGGVDSRVAAALFHIDSMPYNARFPTEQELTNGEISLGRLNRMCLKSYGTTVHAYWERRRVEQARFLLEQPGSTVKSVATGLGFSQFSHFSAWFKRHTTISPRAYRCAAGNTVSADPVADEGKTGD